MKMLLVMRHAKSDWSADYDSDHDRPLNQRGVRSARLIGRLIASRSLVPDVVVSSTANRARSTAEHAIESGSWGSRFDLEESLYSSGVNGILDVARERLEAESLMLVGHQPTWSMLVADLTGERVDMKTGAIAMVSWSGADAPGSMRGGALVDLINPRDYFGSEFDL